MQTKLLIEKTFRVNLRTVPDFSFIYTINFLLKNVCFNLKMYFFIYLIFLYIFYMKFKLLPVTFYFFIFFSYLFFAVDWC